VDRPAATIRTASDRGRIPRKGTSPVVTGSCS